MPGWPAECRLLCAAGSPAINKRQRGRAGHQSVTYKGIRVELLYKFNDDWDALITQSYQNMDSRACSTSSQCLGWRKAESARGHPVQPLL